MIHSQRVLHNTNDVSVAVNDFRSAAYTFAYATGDYLYIGCECPFGNLWFDVATANDVTAACAVQYWDGTRWVDAVDVMDETAAGGKSLAQSGRISWNVNRRSTGWNIMERSTDITELASTNIYDRYWMRFAWSATLKPTTAVTYIGQRFHTDAVLFSYYPDLRSPSLMDAYESGKTDWNEQAYMSAEVIVRDLVNRAVITSRGQILDCAVFVAASCHRCAEIVYRGVDASAETARVKAARLAYDEAMPKVYRVDTDNDGDLKPVEKRSHSSFQKR